MGGLPRLVSHRTPSFWAWLAVWVAAALALAFHSELLHRQSQGSAARALASGQHVEIDPATGTVTGHLAQAASKPTPPAQGPKSAEAAATPPTAGPAMPPQTSPEQAKPEAPPAETKPAITPPRETPPTETPSKTSAPATEESPSPVLEAHTASLAPIRDDLQEAGKEGRLPVIGKDGATAMRAYARPAPKTDKPRVALLVMQLGLNPALAQAVLAMPKDISVSISPYAPKPSEWLALARARGHEALLDLPMEPRDFPISDAGPYALSPREDAEENQKRLHWVMERGLGYVGLVATPREHFLTQSSPAAPILADLQKRGLLLVTSSPRAALVLAQQPRSKLGAQLSASTVLDDMLAPDAIDAQLSALEATARKEGQALAILRPYPLSLARVTLWLNGLEARGLQLVPVTALVPETGAHATTPAKGAETPPPAAAPESPHE